MKYQRFEDAPVWSAAQDLFVRFDGIAGHPGFRGPGDLADQLLRAGLSVSNNIAEGFESGTTEQTITFLYYARGSAGEVRSVLRVLAKLERFHDLKSQISDLIAHSESVSRQLRAWANSLQNSEIAGQRRLNEHSRATYTQRSRARAFADSLKHRFPAPGTDPDIPAT